MNTISDNYIDFLTDKFFVEPMFIKTSRSDNNWKEVSRNIQPREIRSHFSHSYYVGYISRKTQTSVLVFDLDCHSISTKKTLLNRKNKIISRFGNPDFIYTSPNNGLHLYYFLDREYHPKEIQSIVKGLIRIRPGEIEFFPNGRGMRLFGGENCQLIGNDLKPLKLDSEEYIHHVWDSNERLNLDEESKNIAQIQKKYSKQFISECEFYIERGLTAPSLRNDTLLKLNRYFQGFKQLSQQETERRLAEWIALKHNGLSKDFNRNPQSVFKQIHEIVIRYNPDKTGIHKKPSFPIQLITPKDEGIIHPHALSISIDTDIELHQVVIDDIHYSHLTTNKIPVF
jgi:hypothetical protein